MAALYLYCVREDRGTPPAPLKGIDGEGVVFGLHFVALEAIVSEVSLENFASEKVQRKAQEDLNWIKEKALVHNRIIQEAMRQGAGSWPLIPMKFGTIFRDVLGLKVALEENNPRIRKVLERVRGKQEWSVKAYLEDRKVFEEKVKGKDDFVREKQREISSLPEGIAYFAEEELEKVLNEEIDRELVKISTSLHESLEKKAASSSRCKLLERALTGRAAPMILNGAYLFPAERIDDFKKEVEILNEQAKGMGLSVEYNGPWPPYNFATW